MSLSSTKPRVHYTEIDSCRLGDHAHCFVIDHPKLAPEWVYTSRVEHIARDGREPIFETRNSIYLPAERDEEFWEMVREGELVD